MSTLQSVWGHCDLAAAAYAGAVADAGGGGTLTESLVVGPGVGDDLSNGIIRVTSPFDEGDAQGNPLIYSDTQDGSRLFDVRDDGTFVYRSGDGSVGASFLNQDQTAGVVLSSSQGVRVTSASASVHSLTQTGLGFFGAAPVAKPTVAGAKLPSDVVLASLLTALVNLGLITDTST